LVDVLQEGRLVYDSPSIEEMRQNRIADLEWLDPGVKRLMNPHIYHVSLTKPLWDLKHELIQSAKEMDETRGG
jgi:nicotinate phosphoribosyltransferase